MFGIGEHEHKKLSLGVFDIEQRRIDQILNPEKKMNEDITGDSRLMEDVGYWVKILEKNLEKRSGERSDTTLRSSFPKRALYNYFRRGWYATCLDEQLSDDPTLLQAAQAAASSVMPCGFKSIRKSTT